MAEINELIIEKIKEYPEEMQKVLIEVVKLAKVNKETVISEQLEGIVRSIIK